MYDKSIDCGRCSRKITAVLIRECAETNGRDRENFLQHIYVMYVIKQSVSVLLNFSSLVLRLHLHHSDRFPESDYLRFTYSCIAASCWRMQYMVAVSRIVPWSRNLVSKMNPSFSCTLALVKINRATLLEWRRGLILRLLNVNVDTALTHQLLLFWLPLSGIWYFSLYSRSCLKEDAARADVKI